MNYCKFCGKKVNKKNYVCEHCGNFYKNEQYDLEFLEKYRLSVVKKFNQVKVIKAILFLLIMTISFINTFVLDNLSLSYGVIWLLIFILILIPGIFTKKREIKQFDLMYKKIIVHKVIKQLYDNVIYKPLEGFSKKDMSKMIDVGDRFNSSDYIETTYKNIKFKQADLSVEQSYVDSNGNASYTSLFKGTWLIFEFNKKFNVNFEISEKIFPFLIVNRIIQKNKYEKVEIEDEDFNNKYDIYASNPVDVFYILTPPVIEKIKELKSKIARTYFVFCFVGNQLHIGLNNGYDKFEHNIREKIDFEKDKLEIEQQLNCITQLIDILENNSKLLK